MNRDVFKAAEWFKAVSTKSVIIGGAGGISSWLTILMARLGTSIIVYDEDLYEDRNLGGQLFIANDVGTNKAQAVSKFSHMITPPFGKSGKVTPVPEMYTHESMTSAYMLSGFDNMTARKIMFEKWKNGVRVSHHHNNGCGKNKNGSR